MQKKLIALAIAGLSSAAFAQSTVTISGNFDMGYQNTNTQTAAQGKDTTPRRLGPATVPRLRRSASPVRKLSAAA
ncbi:MAG: porin [Rhodocyclales bacterium]|nr:porin [Rhodocyclales bacterium]